MSASESSIDEPGTPSDNSEHDAQPRRNVVVRALTSLKGWQAIPAAVITLYFFLGIFGPSLAPLDPDKSELPQRFCPPLAIDALAMSANVSGGGQDCRASNVLGTDQTGRDIFSRVLHGARTSLQGVGLSVLFGTVAGTVIGVWVNGLRSRLRWVGYGLVVATLVPFGVFVLVQPYTLLIFGVIVETEGYEDASFWSFVIGQASVAFVVAFALIAVGYWTDDRCVRRWISGVEAEDRAHGFCSLFRHQILASGPWIALSAVASAALLFPHSAAQIVQTSAIAWWIEPEYLFEHLGMFSPSVAMVLVPIAFVFFGVWWFLRHLRGRIDTAWESVPTSFVGVDESVRVHSTDDGAVPEDVSDRSELGITHDDGGGGSADSAMSDGRRRWLLAVVVGIAVLAVIRFGVVEALPIVRVLAQDTFGSYQSASAISLQGRSDALNCANELNSRVMTLRSLPPEGVDIDAGQRCLDLYYQHRNAPTHRLTIDYGLRSVTQVLTLALIGFVVAVALWDASGRLSDALRRTVEVCVVLVTVVGLSMVFGSDVWFQVAVRWFDPVGLASDGRALAISRTVFIVRDLSVAFGITYLVLAVAQPCIGSGDGALNVDAASSWASFVLPCVLLASGLLIVFHYPFPSTLLFIDDILGVISDPTEELLYISGRTLSRHWLWTYWFASIGYAAMVVALFAVSILGFRRLAQSDANVGDDLTIVSPDSPSQDADPI